MTTHPQRTRAPKPNQHERAQRQAAIDVLLTRALHGALTIPEAAVLAEYVRAERRAADKTRQSLADTTRALQRHREAADAEIRRLEGLCGPQAAGDAAGEGREGRDATSPPEGPSAPAHDDGPSVREAAADDRRWFDCEKEGA